ncbi:MAG: DUF2330 domain-containing protein [Planctomycetota bacterium]
MRNLKLYMLNNPKRLFYVLVLSLMVTGKAARGDGKFFYMEKVPVGIPYQRALLMFEDGKETLILQSQYKTVGAEDVNSIAWVVPVPAVPKLASMDAKEARFMFFWLGRHSGPTDLPIVKMALFITLVALISFLIEKLLNRFYAKLTKAGAKSLTVSGLRIAIMLIVCFMLAVAILMPSLGSVGEVDVLKAETVGIYDVKVIRGDDAGTVTQWLQDNGFGFEEKDSKVFDQYVKKGWCFVTAKVGREVDPNSEGAISEGLAAPLILRFDSKEAVYPMALTGTTGENTEVLLYIFSDHKMECGDRLKLAFFGETSSPFGQRVSFKMDPNDFFRDVKTKSWQMCKFKGTLRPDQMKEDIVFKQAKDDEPYREIRWW